MPVNDQQRIPLPQDVTKSVERQPDGRSFLIHYTGGLRAYERAPNSWFVMPIYDKGPCAKGLMSKAHMGAFLKQSGVKPISFQDMGWINGMYHSRWVPIVPGRRNNATSPSDHWSRISGNLSRQRTADVLKTFDTPSVKQITELMDGRGPIEGLAQAITLSLRNIDISVEQIAEFYHERLIDLMASGLLDGRRSATSLEETLYAHVHAFFMHVGAARDYLAALVAARIGLNPSKVDALSRLVERLRTAHFNIDPILKVLVDKGYLRIANANSSKIETAGWLADISQLRNKLVHTRPYGFMFAEMMGYAATVDGEHGLFRYCRPIIVHDAEADVLELINDHYATLSSLFLECAEVSGYNTGIAVLTDEDIVSFDSR